MPHRAASSVESCLGEQTFRSPVQMRGSWDSESHAMAAFRIGSPFSRCRCTVSCMACNTGNRSRKSRGQRNDVVRSQSDLGPCRPCDLRQNLPYELRRSDLRRSHPCGLRQSRPYGRHRHLRVRRHRHRGLVHQWQEGCWQVLHLPKSSSLGLSRYSPLEWAGLSATGPDAGAQTPTSRWTEDEDTYLSLLLNSRSIIRA